MLNNRIVNVRQLNQVSSEAAVIADFIAAHFGTYSIPAPVLDVLVAKINDFYQVDIKNREILNQLFLRVDTANQQAILAYVFNYLIEHEPTEKPFKVIADLLGFNVDVYDESAELETEVLEEKPVSVIYSALKTDVALSVVYNSEEQSFDRFKIKDEISPRVSGVLQVDRVVQARQLLVAQLESINENVEAKRSALTANTHRRLLALKTPEHEIKDLEVARKEVKSNPAVPLVRGSIRYTVAEDEVILVDTQTQIKLDEQLARKLQAIEDKRGPRRNLR